MVHSESICLITKLPISGYPKLKKVGVDTTNLILLIIVIFSLSCCKNKNSVTENQLDSTAFNQPVTNKKVSVTAQLAAIKTFSLRSTANGLIRAPLQSRLSFRISGTINKITVRNGSPVILGQALAYLDDQDQRMAVRLAQDQINEARVQLRALIADYGGQELDTNSLNSNARTFIFTKSGYYKAQTALAQAQQQLSYTILRAPFNGIIANLNTKPYNFITSFEPFCTVLSRSSILVEFSILESELAFIQMGLPVRISPISMPSKSYIGQVSEINPLVNGQGLALIKARIDRPDNSLLEGMNAQVVIEHRLSHQIVIPKSAIVERSGRKVVFTSESGFAKWHYVTVAHENDSEVAISQGLRAGEWVIVNGNINLAHDSPISVVKL